MSPFPPSEFLRMSGCDKKGCSMRRFFNLDKSYDEIIHVSATGERKQTKFSAFEYMARDLPPVIVAFLRSCHSDEDSTP